jgi:L-seryl-tRNA(Ser) seleniumtransferase
MAEMSVQDQLRRLPSVDAVLQMAVVAQWAKTYGHDLIVGAVRETTQSLRQMILAGAAYVGEDELLARVQARLQEMTSPTIRPVINATGVILHTNLGRAPLGADVLAAMAQVGQGYSNLEFDLEAGRRGSRYVHAEALLRHLTGAEASLLVNNNAGAVLLVLSALARGREVIISRGQLVEIGGGFRIPDVMAQSGASLVEVGTTNRTNLSDYASAIGDDTCALMRVHSSNFRIVGFAHQPGLDDLVALARERQLLILDDLGSGTLIDTQPFGLMHEPMVQESVAAGVDIVTFSGDKLLGGPQAGIILGKADLIARLRHHPLTRALRVDKAAIAGVQANLLYYVRGEALEKVPIWQMISMSLDEITVRARHLLELLGPAAKRCELLDGESMVGGGSLPQESLPTTLIGLPGEKTASIAKALRTGSPSVVARIQSEKVLLDLRTVLPRQIDALVARLREVL